MLHKSTPRLATAVAMFFALSPWVCTQTPTTASPGTEPIASDVAPGARIAHYTLTARTTQVMESGDHQGFIPVDVAIRMTAPPPDRAVFEIPVWTPGSYYRREFPERIRNVSATDEDGNALDILRLHRSAWQVRTEDSPEITFSYTVRLAPRDRSMLRDERRRAITFEGPRVWMYLRGPDGTPTPMPCHVRFDLPDGWGVYSGLVQGEDGHHFAPSYDFLADCPTKLGVCQVYDFDLRGCRFEVVVDAREELNIQTEEWLAGISAICGASADVFGGTFPMDRYVFLFTAQSGFGGGGLEHLTSTNIGTGAATLLRNPKRTFGIVAHEFFHTWNVKRVRPVELGPFRYDRENYTTGMWVAEGWTSYYDELLLVRAGLRNAEDYWPRMGRTIGGFENTHARQFLSAEEASRRYWLNKPSDRILSYYTAGQVLAMLLDIEIRDATGGARGLDSVFRTLEAQRVAGDDQGYGFGGGYTGKDIEAAVAAVAGHRIGGMTVGEWFDRYVRGTVTPDYEEVLKKAGLNCTIEWQVGKRLRGVQARGEAVLFADHNRLDGGDRSGSLDALGLSGTLKAVGETEITSSEQLEAMVKGMPLDTEVVVTYVNGYGRETRAVAFIERTQRARVLVQPMGDATPEQLKVRESLIQGDPLPR